MMSKKIPQCCEVVQSEHDQPSSNCPVDRSIALSCRNKAEPSQRNGEMASSSPESLNGDAKRSGKIRRRKKRSSDPGRGPEGKMDSMKEEKHSERGNQLPDSHSGLTGIQSECANIWFERSIYEQAESLYQCWLVSSFNETAQLNQLPSAPRKHSQCTVAPSSSRLMCSHSDQVACHHVIQAVWVNKMIFDKAECYFIVGSMPSIPSSLDLPSQSNYSIAPRTPDDGYQSLVPTPATPIIQQAVVTPTCQQPINGLPHFPVELLKDVWLKKPLYDHAEAVFYQSLCGNNSSKRATCGSTSRSSDHSQSLDEEEEQEKEEVEVVMEDKRVVPQGKAEVFHALLPIQEEEEPAEIPEKEEVPGGGVCYFLHPYSERVWLDKRRYEAAESRLHYSGSKAEGRRPEAAVVAPTAPLRDKYDLTGRMEPLQMFQFNI